MKIDWTPNKIASLSIIQKISKLPFEVSVFLELHDNGYSVLAYNKGTFQSVRIPLTEFFKFLRLKRKEKDKKIAFIHNHPNPISTNDCFPSGHDSFWAYIINLICKRHNFSFVDAIIVSPNNRYFSYKENGAK